MRRAAQPVDRRAPGDLGDPRPQRGAGALAAVSLGFAAAIVTMVARASADGWEDGAGIAAQARALQARAEELAGANAVAFRDAREALGAGRAAPGDDLALGRRLEHAADVPLRIARTAADIAELGALATRHGVAAHRADAAAAALQAAASAAVAWRLVEVNLALTRQDWRRHAARAAAELAAEAAEEALLELG